MVVRTRVARIILEYSWKVEQWGLLMDRACQGDPGLGRKRLEEDTPTA